MDFFLKETYHFKHMADQSLAAKTTRSILVIEEEYDLRVALLEALSEHQWNVLFALTEETISEAIKNVAGVILNWDLPALLDRDQILKIIGETPTVIAHKPYTVEDVVRKTHEKISTEQFFVGDVVVSRITPSWGVGRVVSIFPDRFYGVIFREGDRTNSPEVALRCHYSGLKLK